MNILKDLIPPGDHALLWIIQAAMAVGVITLFAGGLIFLLGKIPLVGPLLAAIVRILAGNYEKWLNDRLPRLAEVAVQAAEERYRASSVLTEKEAAARSKQKLGAAIGELKRLAPGVPHGIAKTQVEAALVRVRAAGQELKTWRV